MCVPPHDQTREQLPLAFAVLAFLRWGAFVPLGLASLGQCCEHRPGPLSFFRGPGGWPTSGPTDRSRIYAHPCKPPGSRSHCAARLSRRVPRGNQVFDIGHPVRFELSERTREAVDDYFRSVPRRVGEVLFPSRRHTERCLTTRQYSRLVSAWIAGINLDPALYCTHSLRGTKATLIRRRIGNLRAVSPDREYRSIPLGSRSMTL